MALACHLCSIGDTGQDIGFLQARILIQEYAFTGGREWGGTQ
jgi:hypothetical protein